jgi:hypothetical protein
VVEWFKALVLKTSEVQASVGSNPTLSAIFLQQRCRGLVINICVGTLEKNIRIVYTIQVSQTEWYSSG